MGEPAAARSPSLAESVEAWCRRQGLGQPDACPRCLGEARLHWTLSGWRCGDCRAEVVLGSDFTVLAVLAEEPAALSPAIARIGRARRRRAARPAARDERTGTPEAVA